MSNAPLFNLFPHAALSLALSPCPFPCFRLFAQVQEGDPLPARRLVTSHSAPGGGLARYRTLTTEGPVMPRGVPVTDPTVELARRHLSDRGLDAAEVLAAAMAKTQPAAASPSSTAKRRTVPNATPVLQETREFGAPPTLLCL